MKGWIKKVLIGSLAAVIVGLLLVMIAAFAGGITGVGHMAGHRNGKREGQAHSWLERTEHRLEQVEDWVEDNVEDKLEFWED